MPRASPRWAERKGPFAAFGAVAAGAVAVVAAAAEVAAEVAGAGAVEEEATAAAPLA